MVQQLFPEIQRDVLRAWTSMILEDPDGAAPHDAGSKDPWIQWSQSSGPSAAPAPVNGQPINEPTSFIFQAYSYFQATGDDGFLRFAYPAMLKTLQFEQAHIAPGDHLPLDGPLFTNTYDLWPMIGHGIYDSELMLLSEDVMIDATRRALALAIPQATSNELQSLSKEFPQAKAQFENELWDEANAHYKIDDGSPEYSDGILADALFAQHLAEDAGLPDLVDPGHIPIHLKTAFPLLTQFKDTAGQILGAANGVNNLGQEIRTAPGEGSEVWTGTSWMLAATLYREGTRLSSSALQDDALTLGRALYHQIYENEANGFAFNVPEAWGVSGTSTYRDTTYLRPRSVWELLDAVRTPRITTGGP